MWNDSNVTNASKFLRNEAEELPDGLRQVTTRRSSVSNDSNQSQALLRVGDRVDLRLTDGLPSRSGENNSNG